MGARLSRSLPLVGLLGAACLATAAISTAAPPDGTFSRFDLGSGISVDAIAGDDKGSVFVSSTLANKLLWIDNQYGLHTYSLPTANSFPGALISYCRGALVALGNLDRFAAFSYLPEGSSNFVQTPQINFSGSFGDLTSGKGDLIYAAINDGTSHVGSILSYDVRRDIAASLGFGAKGIDGLIFDRKNSYLFASDLAASSIYRIDLTPTTPAVVQFQFTPGAFSPGAGDFARGCNGETYFTANQAIYRMITTAGNTTFDAVTFTGYDPIGIMVRHEDCNIYTTLDGAQFFVGQLKFAPTPGGQPTFNIVGRSDVYLGYIGAIKRPKMPVVSLRSAALFATDPASECPSLDFAVQGNNTVTHGDDLYWFKLPQQTCPPPIESETPRRALPAISLRYSF